MAGTILNNDSAAGPNVASPTPTITRHKKNDKSRLQIQSTLKRDFTLLRPAGDLCFSGTAIREPIEGHA